MAAIIGWVVVMAQQLNFFDYAYELVLVFLIKTGRSATTLLILEAYLFLYW